jgi:hypothetical protein
MRAVFDYEQQHRPSVGQPLFDNAAAAKAGGAATVARMKAIPTDDVFGAGRIREDGRKIHTAYLFEVKKPLKASMNGTCTSRSARPQPRKPSVHCLSGPVR